MNNRLFSTAIIISLVYLTACKKDTATVSPTSSNANTPTCAYYYNALSGGQLAQFITFFDLRSTNTADKKYFTVQLKFQGVADSFEVVTTTQSINNIAPGFPPDIIEYPGYGWVNQWTNPQYRLLSNGSGSYYKDTIPRNPQSNIYYLYQNFLSGALQGEWPQSNLQNYRVPTGVNGETVFYNNTVFYFKKGLCLKPAINPIAEPTATFYTGAPNIYDWKNINSAIQIPSSIAPGLNNFYFLDFKNWQFFKWKQFMDNTVSPAQVATVFEGYKSLDSLFKWPAGWGKK